MRRMETAKGRNLPALVTICFILSLFSAAIPAAKAAAAGYSAIVVDADTGRVLHAQAADTQRYPASLTKMMTLYMAFDALKAGQLSLNQRLHVSPYAAGQSPSAIGLKAGQTITVRDAILAAVTKSANDATVVLGEAIGGTESQFAEMMTRRAHRLGMHDTTFRNASGLPDPKQKTTARDMATLALALLKNHKDHYHYFATPEFEWDSKVFTNHNHLLRNYEGVDGIKTGFIRASGFNLVASAVRDGRRVIGVVFGGTSGPARDARMVKLLDMAFENQADGGEPLLADGRGTSFSLISSANAATPVAKGKKKGKDAAQTTVAAKAPKARKKASKSEAWAVQLGAFRQAKAAKQALAKAQTKVAGAEPAVEPVRSDNGTLYRARLTGLTEADARNACSSLKRQNLSCTVVPAAG